jgi:putative hydrolase of the HAD superfamily
MIKQKTILFDCGDTLIHLNPSKEEVVSRFLRGEGISVSTDAIIKAYRIIDFCFKQSSIKLANPKDKKTFLLGYNLQLLKALGLSLHAEDRAEKLYMKFAESRHWELFSDTEPVLASLTEHGFKCGIVANWDNGLPAILKRLSIARFFYVIISSSESQVEKPAPDIFNLALEKLGIKASEAIYIGNEYEVDVTGARSAGIEPILIDRYDFFPFADCLKFSCLSELNTYLTGTKRGK